MSEQWMGLHNEERHRVLPTGMAFCDGCDDDVDRYWGCLEDCAPNDPCRCCLAAEVEALRATVQRVREVADDWDRLAALLTSHGVRHDLDVQHAAQRLDRALDGGDE